MPEWTESRWFLYKPSAEGSMLELGAQEPYANRQWSSAVSRVIPQSAVMFCEVVLARLTVLRPIRGFEMRSACES